MVTQPRRPRTITWPEVLLSVEGPYVPFDRVRWRGDPSSYVDVFDVRIASVDGTDGTPYGNAVRLAFPVRDRDLLERWDRPSAPAEVDPAAVHARTVGSYPLITTTWGGGRALRMYDRGACSRAASWESIAQALSDGLDQALAGEPTVATPTGNWTLTAQLRAPFRGERDTFVFSRLYQMRIPSTLLFAPGVLVSLEGRFVVVDGQLTYQLVEGFLHASAFETEGNTPFDVAQSMLVEATISREIVRALAQPLDNPALIGTRCRSEDHEGCFETLPDQLELGAGAPPGSVQPHNLRCLDGLCHFVPNVYRVNHRVDGIEVVLSEAHDPDPLEALLIDAGVCDRDARRLHEPVACLKEPLREITPHGLVGVHLCGIGVIEPR